MRGVASRFGVSAETVRKILDRHGQQSRDALKSHNWSPPGDQSWRLVALCREHDHPEWWFPTGRNAATGIALCRRCPVRVPCLRCGESVPDVEGVWGGVLFRRGRRA